MNKSKHQLPEYGTEGSVGRDSKANLENDIVLKQIDRIKVPTGLFLEIPVGYEAKIGARGGLAIKKGIAIMNSSGTIDADYRGEVCIILVNLSKENFVIEDGEKIYQMIINRHEKAKLESVDILLDSERENGEFGHTGKK